MYPDTGAGTEPVMPAMMAMAVLLQEYAGVSDAEVVELTVMDKRWQSALGRLGERTPAFSQGAFRDFRERLIRHDMDRRLLERTRELARKTEEFDWKRYRRECASRWIPARWWARGAWKTRSIFWHTQPARLSRVQQTRWRFPLSKSPRQRVSRCCWRAASKQAWTCTGRTPGLSRRQSGA